MQTCYLCQLRQYPMPALWEMVGPVRTVWSCNEHYDVLCRESGPAVVIHRAAKVASR